MVEYNDSVLPLITNVCLFQPLADVVVHVERGYRMEAPECCPPEVYTIMKKAWALKPDDRPTFHLVLEELNALRSVRV